MKEREGEATLSSLALKPLRNITKHRLGDDVFECREIPQKKTTTKKNKKNTKYIVYCSQIVVGEEEEGQEKEEKFKRKQNKNVKVREGGGEKNEKICKIDIVTLQKPNLMFHFKFCFFFVVFICLFLVKIR